MAELPRVFSDKLWDKKDLFMVEHAVENMYSRRICYVDDSKTSSYVTKRMLEKQGYIVEHFARAEDALEAVLDRDYDLLLTDLMITTAGDGVNGDDLIRLIRLSGHPHKMHLPIIVVTGVADKTVLEGLIETGANRVLSKPLDEVSLDTAIQEVLDESSQIAATASTTVSAPQVKQEKSTAARSETFLTLKDQLSSQLEKQEERFIPTLTEEVSVDLLSAGAQASSDELTPIDAKKFEKRDIQPAKSVVDIPLVGEPPKQTTANKQEQQVSKTDKTTRRVKANDLKLQPLDDIDVPSFIDHFDNPVEDSERSPTQSQHKYHNDAWSEIESFFDESENDEPEVCEPSEAVLDASKWDDILGAAQKNAEPDQNEAFEKNAAEESIVKETENKQTRQEKRQAGNKPNPLLDLLDQFENEEIDTDTGKTPVFTKPAFKIRFNPRTSKILLAILAAILIIPGLAYMIFQETITEVDFVTVEMAPIHESVMVTGRVVSRKQVNVTSYFSGKISEVKVKDGAFVKKGTVLATLDGKDAHSRVNRAQAKLISIQEKVALARKSLERLQRALDKGAVSRQMVEDAETDWKTESAKQSLAEEELKEAKRQVDRLNITAPFDGLVASMVAQEGQWLAPPEPLAKLVDINNVEVELRVDVADSSTLLEGQTVDLSSDAFPGKIWQETITRIASTTDRENRSNFVNVFVTLGKDAPKLKVGQQVDAAVRTKSNSRALVLPFEAIKQVNGQTMVAVALNGRVHYVPVVTGIESLSNIEITKGLTIGQRVLLAGGLVLEEGRKVTFVQN